MVQAVEKSKKLSLTPIAVSDLPFLIISGLDRERRGVQYPGDEWLKQFKIAPMRFFNASTRRKSFIIRVDGKRAGYIGLNPLSTNIEYYVMPWARGGIGSAIIRKFLLTLLPSSRDEHAFMLSGNDRSVHAFRSGLKAIGLESESDYEYFEYDGGQGFRVIAGAKPQLSRDDFS
jgi:hypothetical protein